ncbi:MAG: rod shape-determining protein [Eubacterium sp.]|nr:rod shape-determining protein [Eubacterium sp.]
MFGYDLGFDLGTNNVVISVPSKGVVLNEPCYVAYDIETEKILYAGRRAYYLEGREPKGVAVVQPVERGVISNYALTQQMLRFFINRVIKKNVFRPRVVASVPALATDVEKRTLVSVIISAGARSVCLVESTLCAAFGSGVDPLQPNGVFVVDIGAGSSDMAVISQGSMNQIETVKIGGNDFDREIIKLFKDKYNLLIGIRTAEDIKKLIGCAIHRDEPVTMSARGRDAENGMPKTVDISSEEIYECLKPLFSEITAAAQAIFERTSPQLAADIVSGEVLLTGGSAELYGLDKLLSDALNLGVKLVPQPALCVSKGAQVALNKMHILDNYGYQFKTKEDVRIR